ncbi:hypothetical protein I302_108972 [Kwoniella bestiolae CBS 10118]|uniref:Uncharacterized protein n=1 Tax=Kwoniella bestiolae CBS 10118 TaxID=1296100 RepID=A0A1B9FUM9_9TREE|nr:hypothetical protein I302_08113 [Kwoniella bestiolae CBS 10118]OCF22464.1 hypothetical protein I302_08113 [Kwoniella bestiolae CBS 10118]
MPAYLNGLKSANKTQSFSIILSPFLISRSSYDGIFQYNLKQFNAKKRKPQAVNDEVMRPLGDRLGSLPLYASITLKAFDKLEDPSVRLAIKNFLRIDTSLLNHPIHPVPVILISTDWNGESLCVFTIHARYGDFFALYQTLRVIKNSTISFDPWSDEAPVKLIEDEITPDRIMIDHDDPFVLNAVQTHFPNSQIRFSKRSVHLSLIHDAQGLLAQRLLSEYHKSFIKSVAFGYATPRLAANAENNDLVAVIHHAVLESNHSRSRS